MYIYISNILHPIGKCPHRGFTPLTTCQGCRRRAGGGGRSCGVDVTLCGGSLMGYISILHIGYWISIYICMFLFGSVWLLLSAYIYIYIYMYIYMHIWIYMYIYIHYVNQCRQSINSANNNKY